MCSVSDDRLIVICSADTPPQDRAHPCVRATCVLLHDAAWGVAICRIIVPYARVYRIGVWVGFVRSALLLADVLCWVGC